MDSGTGIARRRQLCIRLAVTLIGPLLLLASAPDLQAQPENLECDRMGLRPIQGSGGYVARTGDVRCEGFYESEVSAGGLEVVSFTSGALAFDPAAVDEMSIRPRLPGDDGRGPVNIRAVALGMRAYYRMDARVPPGGSMRWPVAHVLRPWGLTGSDIGVFGWLGQGGERIFVPVRVSRAGTGAGPDGGSPVLRLRTPLELDRLLWRSRDQSGAPTAWRPVVERRIGSGQSVAFTLPPGPRGVLALEFRAKRRNADIWLPLDISVWRPGP